MHFLFEIKGIEKKTLNQRKITVFEAQKFHWKGLQKSNCKLDYYILESF